MHLMQITCKRIQRKARLNLLSTDVIQSQLNDSLEPLILWPPDNTLKKLGLTDHTTKKCRILIELRALGKGGDLLSHAKG